MANIRVKLQSKKTLLLLAALFLLGVFTGVSLYWIAFWFLLFWVSGSLLWLLLTALRLQLELELTPSLTARYSTAELKIILFHRSFLPFPPGELCLAGTQKNEHSQSIRLLHLPEGETQKVDIDRLTPSRHAEFAYQVHCYYRGYHQVGPVKARLFSPFGGLLVEKHFPAYKKLTVQPRLLPFEGRFSLKNPAPGKETKRKHAMPDPLENEDLKPFVPGDPPRRIHWKVSAKQGDFYIRRPQNRGESGLLVCVEFNQNFYHSSLEQDLALEKTLSLTGHLLAKGHRVGLLTWDGQMRYLPPATGRNQLLLTRKLFTDLYFGFEGSLAERLLHNPHPLPAAGMIWVVPCLDDFYTASLRRLAQKRELVGVFLTGPPENTVTPFPALSPLQLRYFDSGVGVEEAKIS